MTGDETESGRVADTGDVVADPCCCLTVGITRSRTSSAASTPVEPAERCPCDAMMPAKARPALDISAFAPGGGTRGAGVGRTRSRLAASMACRREVSELGASRPPNESDASADGVADEPDPRAEMLRACACNMANEALISRRLRCSDVSVDAWLKAVLRE